MTKIERDAARYRFLRNKANPDDGHPYVSVHKQTSWGAWFNTYEKGAVLDALIDTEMDNAPEVGKQ